MAPGAGQEQDVVRELLAQKQALLMELKQYESNAKFNEKIFDNLEGYDGNGSGIIPATTRLQIGISTNSTATDVNTNKKNTVILVKYIFIPATCRAICINEQQHHNQSSNSIRRRNF